MPVTLPPTLRPGNDDEFRAVVYDVMGCVFDIHNEFGRFFSEKIYKQELARRLSQIELEAPLLVQFDPFRKTYLLDVLAAGCAVIEFKAAESIHERHRSQLMQYLLLCDLPHGKLVNMRPETVEHEFVNAPWRRQERTQFKVTTDNWIDFDRPELRDWLTALVRDLGTGLDVSLYEDAITDFLGGPEQLEQDIEIFSAGQLLATQRFRLVQPGVAFKITTFTESAATFGAHANRLLSHTPLKAIQWINIGRHEVTFQTLRAAQV